MPSGWIFDETTFVSGYGPRAILAAAANDTLYVGSKDGSVTILKPPSANLDIRGFERVLLTGPGGRCGGVRALCELDDRHLLAGHADGSVSLLATHRTGDRNWLLKPGNNAADEENGPGPVRAIGKLGNDQVLVSCRDAGFVVRRSDEVWEPAPIRGYPKHAVRFMLPLRCGDSDWWAVITDRCDVFLWNGDAGSFPDEPLVVWSKDQPGLVNDYALLRGEERRRSREPADGFFLATEAGVYLLRPGEGTSRLACDRIALPGLGTMPTALSYAEIPKEPDQGCYLWVADARGNSHLFGQPGCRPDLNDRFRFSRSGVRHSFRETLLCFLWVPKAEPSRLLCGQARRNDQIVLGLYWKPEAEPSVHTERSLNVRLRRLLISGRWTGLSDRRRLKNPADLTAILLNVLKELKHGPEDRWSERCNEEWPTATLLAELFERLGEQDDLCQLLIDAIRSPQARLVSNFLANTEVTPAATRLLTQSLLGVIHRSRGDRQLAHLGLILWLRNRQDELLEAQGPDHELLKSLQKDIGFARKWGLHGAANAMRRDLVGPIQTLREQGAEHPDSPLALDHLTYQTLLFNRRISEIDRRTCDQMRGRTAWDVCLKTTNQTTVFAVSWMWGGVELFRLHPEPTGDPPSRFEPLVRFPPPRPATGRRQGRTPPPPERASQDLPCGWREGGFERQKHGYSRVVHLGQVARGSWYLLCSPTFQTEGAGGQRQPEEILIWSLKDWKPADEPSSRLRLEPGQSLYSALELKRGYLLLGLRGHQGNALVKLLHVRGTAPELCTTSVAEWSPVPAEDEHVNPEGSSELSMRRNRVWSLAKQPGTPRNGPARVVVGCEGGQIYLVEVYPGKKTPFGDHHVVGRLNSPVRSLLCGEGGDGQQLRIYAGGEDGTIIAWQATDGEEPTYASLWATQEQGPVASLHDVDFVDHTNGKASEPRRSMILAITRQGRAVLLDARSRMARPSEDSQRPERVPVPGSRFGRYGFPDGVWASSLLDSETFVNPIAEHTGAFCALLSASGDGSLSIHSMHSPSKSGIRKKRYRQILVLAQAIARDDDNMRLGEAVFGAVPSLSWVLVRWLLDPVFDGSFDGESPYPDPQGIEEWWLPRHLRPLLAVRKAWDELEKGCPEEHATKVARTIGTALAAALERAWHLEDLHLYQEICSLALKRANYTLFSSFATKADNEGWLAKKQDVAELYEQVYRAIETSLPSWLGATERREARARAIVAKHIVDGDTVWKVAREAAKEPRDEPDPHNLSPYWKVLKMRVAGVRELVHKRDPMVSLEALRAANLSLMRLCGRLVRERRRKERVKSYRPSDPVGDGEIRWSIFEDYFERLTAAAARTFHARLELTDALAHEYSRTFALVICACPSATIRIAYRLTETLLIRDLDSDDDLSRRVLRQLDVLASIGLPCPSWARTLFQHVTTMPAPEDRLNPTSQQALARIGVGSLASEDKQKTRLQVGAQNTEDLYHQKKLYDSIEWFISLAEHFRRDARGIDLSVAAVRKQLNALQPDENSGGQHTSRDTFLDSRAFWVECTQELLEQLKKDAGNAPEPGRQKGSIRPEVVLWSRTVSSWAASVIDSKLHRLQKDGKLFLPELAIFRKILEELRDAAGDFRTSAAVHKNLVGGILGHHLLENLDEHILELEEIAYALDPVGVQAAREDTLVNNSWKSTARRFARYLTRRAQGAESIPKNLRVLQTLLTADLEDDEEAGFDFGALVSHHGWSEASTSDIKIKRKELVTLGLTLEELAQNHHKHSGRRDRKPVIERLTGKEPGILLEFPFEKSAGDEDRPESNYARLSELRGRYGLQTTFAPRQDRDIGSTGSGLYLANMAAAVVGWKLWIEDVTDDDTDESLARCIFHLQRHDKES